MFAKAFSKAFIYTKHLTFLQHICYIFKNFSKHKDEFNLKEEDLNIIKDFFFSLGESGVYGQEKVFSLTSEELKRKYLEAEEECKVNRKMYRGIGVCVGAIIAIFFI